MASQVSTHWTVIRKAQGQGPEARAALEQLIRRYDGFLLALIRRARRPPDQTPEDTKQELLERVLKDLPRIVEGKGKFRGWLAIAVRSHVCNSWKRWWAQKNPDRHIDCFEAFDVTTTETAEHELLRSFAVDTLRHAERLQRARTPNLARFEALRRFLPIPDMDLEELGAVARRLGMRPGAVGKAIHDLRKEFRECLREAVSDTLDPDELPPPNKPLSPNQPPSGRPRATAGIERELSELYASLFPVALREVRFAR